MGIDARVKTHLRVRKGDGTDYQEIAGAGEAIATIMLGRDEADEGHVVLLRRRYLHELADELKKVTPEEMTDADAGRLKTFLIKSKEAERARGFLCKGAGTKEAGPLGTRFSIAVAPEKKAESAWLQFMLSIDDDALHELFAADPLIVVDDAAEEPGGPPPAADVVVENGPADHHAP